MRAEINHRKTSSHITSINKCLHCIKRRNKRENRPDRNKQGFPNQSAIRYVFLANLEWIEGVAMLVTVLVVVFVTAINDWRKERQFRGLQNKIEKDHQASVVRDNRIQQIPIADLVVGDLCFIKYGNKINFEEVIGEKIILFLSR